MTHHEEGPSCPECEKKLGEAHEYLGQWFRSLKSRYINTHIAWAFRGQADQDHFFDEKRTKCRWPYSPHNNMKDGKPYALALDLFQIDEDGTGRWSPAFFAKVNQENTNAGEPISWGGKFKTLGDADHYQYNPKSGG